MSHIPTYPPLAPWDPRMLTVQTSPTLQPVETLHSNPWFVVRNRGGYYTMEANESHGVVLPVVENRGIIMVRVFRPLLDDATWELPAGGFNLQQEGPEQGMRRELAEETGIWIDDLGRFKPLPPMAIFPNRTPSLIFPFQVDLDQETFVKRTTHDSEISEVACFSFLQLVSMIQKGEIYITMPVAMISRWLLGQRAGT